MPRAKFQFKLNQFREGAVPGLICLEAFRNPTLLDPVKKWLAEGKLVSAGPNPDPLSDMLYLAEAKRSEATPIPSPKQTRRKIDTAGRKSWPYQCGKWARAADDKSGGRTPNPVVGETGVRWQAGYNGVTEPPIQPIICLRCREREIRLGRAFCQVCEDTTTEGK